MYLRLAFAVAAHLESDVLLVDEVLAVGDELFQKKCLGKMEDVARRGRTVIFVSHNMGSIARLCERALWFENGYLKLEGPSNEVISSYLSTATVGAIWAPESTATANTGARLTSVRILSIDGEPQSVVPFDAEFRIEISYELLAPIRNLSILCRVTNSRGEVVWISWDTDTSKWNGRVREPGKYLSECKVPATLLRPGRYTLSIGAEIHNVRTLNFYDNVLAFDVSPVGYHLNLNRDGIITPVLEWDVRLAN